MTRQNAITCFTDTALALSLLNYRFGVRIRSPNKHPSPIPLLPNIYQRTKVFLRYLSSGQFNILFGCLRKYSDKSYSFFIRLPSNSDDNLISIRRQGFINIVIKAHTLSYSLNIYISLSQIRNAAHSLGI